jgi:hypothetical protein
MNKWLIPVRVQSIDVLKKFVKFNVFHVQALYHIK